MSRVAKVITTVANSSAKGNGWRAKEEVSRPGDEVEGGKSKVGRKKVEGRW